MIQGALAWAGLHDQVCIFAAAIAGARRCCEPLCAAVFRSEHGHYRGRELLHAEERV